MSEEIWRYSRIGELDLSRFRPFPAEQMGEPGDDRARRRPDRGRSRRRSARASWSAATDAVVHHALDAALEAKGVRGCGIAT